MVRAEMSAKIGVVGMWHLGCVISACWAKLGHRVVGVDQDAKRIENLKAGTPPLFEPHLEDTIKRYIESGHLAFATDASALADADFVFMSYDTPVRDDDSSDVTILLETIDSLAPVLKDGAVVIVSSQSPVGLCAKMRATLKAANATVELAYSPENLRLGEAIDCYLAPGRVIIGTASAEAEAKVKGLFSEIDADLQCMGLESSECVKHGINAWLSTSITFANHLADICESHGARIDDVVRGMKSDPRIGAKAYLAPGIGFSGGTLGRDLKVLEAANAEGGKDATLFGSIHALNGLRKDVVVRKVDRMVGGLSGKTVAVLGLTYKPGTSTLRRSLPLAVVETLAAQGATVRAYDPKADYSEVEELPPMTKASGIDDALEGADVVLLLTDWPDFKAHDFAASLAKAKQPNFFDTKNCLDEAKMTQAGWRYASIGRPTR